MKMTFLGAAHEVTGSCTLIECCGQYGLVDCGMEQGKDIFENQTLPVNPTKIDFVLLTHAHIDHSGNLPLLYKNGFQGSIYATEETCNLCRIMLRDSAHIQEQEAEWRNRKAKRSGGDAYVPIYDRNDAEGAIARLHPVPYGSVRQIGEGFSVRFSDIGHLLGSACIEIWLSENGVEKKLVFSGDVGNLNQPIIRDIPTTIPTADYVVCESTYGDRLHERPDDPVALLADIIQRTLDRNGNVVIPSFAVGRTQEMLYFIREIKERGLVTNHPDFPVYVDSPMANEATSVYLQCSTECLDDKTKTLVRAGINPLMFRGLRTAVSTADSRAINLDPNPKVILSASGMCEAGRIRHHLKHNLWREECTILFVGYQAAGTLGRAIHDGVKTTKLFGEEIAVNAEIATLPGKSGHADQDGLTTWIAGFQEKPQLIFVNHGENVVCDHFVTHLEEKLGYQAFAPFSGTEFDLETGTFLTCPDGILVTKKQAKIDHIPTAFQHLLDVGGQLPEVIQMFSGHSNRDVSGFSKDLEKLLKKWEQRLK